jgi:hypothetical protein
MTPDQARAVANAVGEQLKNEWKTTSKVIAAVPNNKRDYKPDPNGRSAWELATHMAGWRFRTKSSPRSSTSLA